MTIIHVAESFSAGVLEFINYLTNNLEDFEHIIIYGEREIKERNADIEEIKKRFSANVSFYKWEKAQKSINPIKDSLAFFNLCHLLKKLDYEVIHLHSSKAGFLGRLAAPFLKNKKILYTPNGAYFLKTDISNFARKSVIILEKLAAKISGEVVCCSKSEMEAYLYQNIPATFINNGITITTNYGPKRSNGTFRIVTSGRLSVQKNPKLFNDIACLLEQEKSVQFIWVGEGDLKEQITASNIQVTGWLTKDQVLSELLKSDLFISTSLWEGLPFSVLEAMELSKPLLLHNCVGNIDLVENNYNGFIFNSDKEAANYIKKMLADKNWVLDMGGNSRKKCEQDFDIKNTSMQYRVKYLSLSK